MTSSGVIEAARCRVHPRVAAVDRCEDCGGAACDQCLRGGANGVCRRCVDATLSGRRVASSRERAATVHGAPADRSEAWSIALALAAAALVVLGAAAGYALFR